MFYNIYHALIRVSQTMKPLNIHYKPIKFRIYQWKLKKQQKTENRTEEELTTAEC